MQKTNFSRITYQLNNLFFGFLSDTWRTKSIGLISVLIGYFLFANFLTKFISEGKNELVMVPIIIIFIEFIISSEDVEFKKPNPLPYLKAIQLSGINKNNSIVFEDSNPGLKSSLAANLPTIFIPSNIPIVLEENIKLDCILDSLGDENNVANVIKGPKLKKSYVDYSFLSDYLMSFSNAKN